MRNAVHEAEVEGPSSFNEGSDLHVYHNSSLTRFLTNHLFTLRQSYLIPTVHSTGGLRAREDDGVPVGPGLQQQEDLRLRPRRRRHQDGGGELGR